MSFKVKNIIKASEDVISKILEKYSDEEYFEMDKIIPIQPELELTISGETEKAILYAIYTKSNDELQALQEKLQENMKQKVYSIEKETKLEYLVNFLLNNDIKEKNITLFDLKNNIKGEFLEELKNDATRYIPFSWEKEIGVNNLEDLGNAYLNNIIKHDAMCAHDWCSKFWGSTGMTIIYEHKGDELILETEWATPIGIIDKLSKEFPETLFTVEFASNGDESCGRYEIKNGELVNYIDLDELDILRIWNYSIGKNINNFEQQLEQEAEEEWDDEMYEY